MTWSFWIFEDVDDGVSSEEHFGDVATFGDGCSFFAFSRHFSPDFLDVFHDHIHVSVEGLDFPEELFVISQGNQYFVVGLDWFGEKGKWSHIECLLLRSVHGFFFLHLV